MADRHRVVLLALALALALGPAGVASAQRRSARCARCAVSVTSVVREEFFRGVPRTPARDAEARARGPAPRGAVERDNFYYRCIYRVRVNGAAYRYVHNISDTFRTLPAGVCARPATRRSVVAQITSVTRRCTDLRAGEYYGYVLEPEPTASP